MKKHQAFEMRSREEFSKKTRRRLIRIVTRLRRMQWDFIHTMDAVGRILGDQETASRKARFLIAAHLCRTMADETRLMRAVVEPPFVGMVGRLLGDCRQLGRHVQAVDGQQPTESHIYPIAVHGLREASALDGPTNPPHVRPWRL